MISYIFYHLVTSCPSFAEYDLLRSIRNTIYYGIQVIMVKVFPEIVDCFLQFRNRGSVSVLK